MNITAIKECTEWTDKAAHFRSKKNTFLIYCVLVGGPNLFAFRSGFYLDFFFFSQKFLSKSLAFEAESPTCDSVMKKVMKK